MLHFKRRWVKFSIWGLVIFISLVALALFALLRDPRPRDIREFSAIREDWERTVYGHALEGGPLTMLGDKYAKTLTQEEKKSRIEWLATRCLQHADKYPNSTSELAALYLSAARGAATESGSEARERLVARIATADLNHLQRAIEISRAGKLVDIIPAILKRIEHSDSHPQMGAMLAYVCSSAARDAEGNQPPPFFAQAADLIVTKCADSPNIYGFCESLGNGFETPPWATQFERHVRTILEVNQDRWVRCTAAMAQASIVQLSIERQPETEQLYQKFLTEFDGQTEYPAQDLEREYRNRAEMQLAAMHFTPVGRPAPELVGVDLNGQPMALSEYRGKVVLVSFWATWCAPCMKELAFERDLATQFANQPFAIVGVNGDKDSKRITDALAKHNITWRSFHDHRENATAISDEWHALYPTMYLIDHQGIIRQRFSGSPDHDALKEMVEELVATAQEEQ